MRGNKLLTISALTFVLMLCATHASSAQTAIQITDGPKVESVSDTTAVVVWTTNVPSSAVVRYGTDQNNLTDTAQQEWGGQRNTGSRSRTHRVEVKNLKPATAYFFQVESGQARGTGTSAKAELRNFTTLSTEEAAQQANQQQSSTNSVVQITDGPRMEFIGDTTAVIAWTTNVPSSTVVRYGTDRNNLSQTSQKEWGGQENAGGSRTHRVEIRNLKANTPYYFIAESGQAEGTGSAVKSEVTPFNTLTSEAATEAYRTKQGVSTIRVQAGPIPQSVTDTTASLWMMTSEEAPVVVKYGTDRNSMNQTAQSPTGKQHSLQLINLQPSATYFYEVSVADGKAKETGQFQTEKANFAAEHPRVYLTKGPVMEYITRRSAIVAWSTNVRASSIVRYGTDPNNLNLTAQAPWGQETHRVEIRNLKPDTKYYFVVESAQAEGSGTLAKSNSAPFMTVSREQQAMRNPQSQ